MKPKITRDWWMCFCDGAGNAHQIPLHDLFAENRARCIDGTSEVLPVGLAATQEKAQEIGRTFKREISAARRGEGEGDRL
jgi:hypothetical protein